MKVKSTTFTNDDAEHSTPIIVEKEMSERDAIREFVQSHSMYTFGGLQGEHIIEAIVNGFFLFNLRENKYMLHSKDELLKYCKDNTVSLEEKMYFWDIFLFNQRPKFLTSEEHDYIRAMGDLDGYVEKKEVVSSSSSSGGVSSSSGGVTTSSGGVSTSSGVKRFPSGFIKPSSISDELAIFLGKPAGTKMARTDVSKEINTYIRVYGLQDPFNGRRINPDEKLKKLLGVSPNDELTYFNLQKYMRPHFYKEP